jgi:replicative DNA helicase
LGDLEAVTQDAADDGAKPISDATDELEILLKARRAGKGITGISTGIKWMDKGLHGLNRGLSYIIAARPGVGKSLVIGQIAANAVYAGYRVLLQTPEMSRMQYLDRLAHGAAGVDYELAQAGVMTDAEEQAVIGWAKMFSKFPFFVDDYGTQTVSRVRANVMRFQPDLLLVDYLQYMTPDDTRANRNQQVGQMSRDLTKIKSDFHIPVVLAAQLNRDIKDKRDKRPELWDLRDSGEIEQDADAVIFLHRESRYDDDAPEDEIEFLCKKFRNGSLWYERMFLAPGANWVVDERGKKAVAS